MRFAARKTPRGPTLTGTKQQQHQQRQQQKQQRWSLRRRLRFCARWILPLTFVAACFVLHARYTRAVLASLEEAANGGGGGTTTTKEKERIGSESEHGSNQRRPLNIVLFYADDWTYKTLGLLNPVVKTPVIDWMAENGVLFTRNCVTTSICMISRATLYTGQYASVHRNFQIDDREMYRPGRWNATLFPLLRDRGGYHIGMVGKWHHHRPPMASRTFATFENYYGKHYVESKPIPTYHANNGSITMTTRVLQHVTEKNEEDAIRFLDGRPRDVPFCLMVSFFATHAEDGHPDQYRPQQRTRHLYDNVTIPMPVTATPDHYRRLPRCLKHPDNVGRSRWRLRYKNAYTHQVMMKKMYRMATEVDAAVGSVLDKLREQKILNSTLIVFTTDNGNLHGEHGLAEKWYPYEESIRVPLVIMDPRMSEDVRNTRNDEFTLNVDLAPTLLSAAGVPVPSVMQGRDIAPLYGPNAEAAKASWRKDFYYEWFTGDPIALPSSLALVRKNVKYILWPEDGTEEVFELSEDPNEETNLVVADADGADARTVPPRTSRELLLEEVRNRFRELKAVAESGVKV